MTNLSKDYPEFAAMVAPLADDEPRAELKHYSIWQFRLANRDALLVLKALGGRLSEEPESVAAARDLGDRLTALRVKQLESTRGSAAVLRERLEKATGKTAEEIIKERP